MIGSFVLATEVEDTHPLKVATSEVKEPTDQKNNFVEEKLDDESDKINASAVAKKIKLGREMNDDKMNPHLGQVIIIRYRLVEEGFLIML